MRVRVTSALLLVCLTGCAVHQPQPDAAPLSVQSGKGTALASPKTQIVPVKAELPQIPDAEAAQKEKPELIPPPREVPLVPGLEPEKTTDTQLNIDQIINAVLVQDPKLRAGFEAINQANADAISASLRPNPTLFTDVQFLPLTRPFTPTDQGGPPQQDVQVSYPIDWYVFGKRAARMAAASHGVRVSEADFADQVRLRVTEAATAYYDALEAKNLLALARQDVANLRRAEVAVLKAVEAGGRTKVEANRIRLDVLRAQQAERDAQNAVIVTKAKLRAIIGRSDTDPSFDVAGSLDVSLASEPLDSDASFEAATKNRPDLQSIRWQAAKAKATMESERRNAFPQLTPTFGYTRQYQRQAIGFPDADSWSAALTMTLPIFDRNQGNRIKAASVAAQNEFTYQSVLANLRAEVETTSQDLRTARAQALAVAGEQLKLAREVLDSVTAAYELGGLPLVDLLDAQRNFRETYRTFISTRAAYWRALYRYQSVLGQLVKP